MQIHKDQVRAPEALYREPALPLRVIRDFANLETKRIVVDSQSAYDEMIGQPVRTADNTLEVPLSLDVMTAPVIH